MNRNLPATQGKMALRESPARSHSGGLASDRVVVDLWTFVTDHESQARLRRLETLLSPDELKRSRRFRFPRDQGRYLVGRAKLRLILARYTGVAPEDIRFEYGEQGKPSLLIDSALRFNLANSGGLVLLALCENHELGVDLEQIRPEFADDHIAEHFFSAIEVAALRNMPVRLQERAFFECWTRKEAFLKAKGGGLSVPLDTFVVSFGPGSDAALLSSKLDPADTGRWRIFDVSKLAPGHVAAVVVDAGNLPVLLETYSIGKGVDGLRRDI